DLEGTQGLNPYEIWGIFPLGPDGLLLATLEAGLFVYDGKIVRPWNTQANDLVKKNSSLGGTMIDGNTLVLNTVLGGVILSDLKGEVIQQIDLERGLKNNTVLRSFIDNGGNLWLGMDNGISYVNINSPFTYFGPSLYHSSVYATMIHEGLLYVATKQGVFYNRVDGSFKDQAFKLVEGTAAQSWNIQLMAGELICANNKGALVIENGKVVQVLVDIGYYGFREIPGHKDYFIGSNYAGFAIFKADGKGMEFSHRIEGIKSSSKDFELDSGQVWLLKDQLLYQLDLMDGLQGFQLKNKYTSLAEGGAGIGARKKIEKTLDFISDDQFYTYSMDRDRFEIDGPLTALFRGLPTISSILQDSGGNLW